MTQLGHLLFAPALHRRRNPQRIAVFGDGAPGDVDARAAQHLDDGVVGQNVGRAFRVDQLLDAMAHRFGGMRIAAVGRRDRGGEEILQFEDAAVGRHVFVGGDARHRRLVHADRVGDGLQVERPQVLDAVDEKRVLLLHDLGRHLEDRLGALIERAHQPGRRLHRFGEIALVGVLHRVLRQLRVVGLVDQNLRQRVGVELDDEAAVRRRAARTRRARSAAPPSSRTRGPAWD